MLDRSASMLFATSGERYAHELYIVNLFVFSVLIGYYH